MISFTVDVSRVYRNKTGYDVSGYRLNTSFTTEQHTPQSFIDTVIEQGWPYTMVHAKRPPEETGAAARGVLTPKHTENFISAQLLTGDDDSQAAGVVNWWLNDPFFARYGWLFVESANSRPGAEKGHPTLLFDQPITDPALYKECLQAFCTYYDRLDWLINIDRTIYNPQPATVHLVGNVCPFDVFEREILHPWRRTEQEKRAALAEAQEQRRKEREAAQAAGRRPSGGQKAAFIAGYLRWLFNRVADTRAGDNPNRNGRIYWAGRCIGELDGTEWARDYAHLWHDAEQQIIDAARDNDYLTDHAHGQEAEVLRIFNRGRARGGEALEEPIPEPVQEPEQELVLDIDALPDNSPAKAFFVAWQLQEMNQ